MLGENKSMIGTKVSVIVPVYGVEKYIERCARSLFAQTLEDIELIFVNDGTKDASIDILRKVQAEYPDRRSIILEHEVNKGLPEARKTGLKAASGDYIIHCDSDDWVEPDYCERLYQTAVSTNSDMVICRYWLTDGENKQADNKYNDTLYEDINHAFPSSIALLSSPYIWNKLVKRGVYDCGLMYPNRYLSEDWVMSVQFAYHSKKTTVIDDKLYNYYVNPISQQRLKDKEACIRKCTDEAENVSMICNWLQDIQLFSKYKAEIVKRKSITKKQLLNVLDDEECRTLWINIFRSTNFQILFNKYIRWDYKRIHVLLLLRLYCPVKKVYKLFKNV